MLAFFENIGFPELTVIALVAVLVFGKNLPQAASKAYLQVRKLRNAVDDLRRESGIEREIRDIERTVREAEWEARRKDVPPPPASVPRESLPEKASEVRPEVEPASAPAPATSPSEPPPTGAAS